MKILIVGDYCFVQDCNKKSLCKAVQEAHLISKKHPDIKYTVMDKKRKTAVWHGVDFLVRDRILEGYYPVCTFKNGEVTMA